METPITMPVIIGSMAVLTFVIRFLPLSILSAIQLPKIVEIWLRNIAIGMLSAMLFQNLFLKQGQLFFSLDYRLFAVAVSLLTAFKTRNILLTVVIGVAAYYAGKMIF